ncbi:hypothetical protein DESC_260061 [Desulfosarcina cetonica]|nr:hypothetical protein DESC_260061 [Desulfosarcina cetonica]
MISGFLRILRKCDFLRLLLEQVYIAQALADDFRLVVLQGDDAGRHAGDRSPVDHRIQPRPEMVMNEGCIMKNLAVGRGGAGRDDRIAQCADQGQADVVGRYPDAGGLAFGEHDFGHQLGSGQDKGVGAGQKAFHGFIGVVGNFGVLADVFQIGADEAERLAFIALFEQINFFDGMLVHDIAADPVKGVGWISDQTAFPQYDHNLVDQPLLGIVQIDREQHDCAMAPWIGGESIFAKMADS